MIERNSSPLFLHQSVGDLNNLATQPLSKPRVTRLSRQRYHQPSEYQVSIFKI